MAKQAKRNSKTNSSKPSQPSPILIAIRYIDNIESRAEPRKWYEENPLHPNDGTTLEDLMDEETGSNEVRRENPSSNAVFDFGGWHPDVPHLTTTRKSRELQAWQLQPAPDEDIPYGNVDDIIAEARDISFRTSTGDDSAKERWEFKPYYSSREELAEKNETRFLQDDEDSEAQSNPDRPISRASVRSKKVRRTSASEPAWRDKARKTAEKRWICCKCKVNGFSMVPFNYMEACKRCYHHRCLGCPCPAYGTDPEDEVAQYFYDKMEEK